MLRPRPCRWFELLTSREDLAPVLESLARTGAVELQTREGQGAALVIGAVQPALEHFDELSKTYRSVWPTAATTGSPRITDPAATLAARIAQLDRWRAQADPLIAERERLAGELTTLSDLARLLEAGPALLPEPGLLAAAGRFVVGARVYASVARGVASDLPPGVIHLTIPAGDEHFIVLVGTRDALVSVDAHFATLKARRIVWPPDLRGSVPQAAREVGERRAALMRRQAELGDALNALARQHDLASVLADIEMVAWLARHGSELSASERLVWVTGWTTVAAADPFCAPLDRQGLRCVVHFPVPPAGSDAPSLLANPPWARIFEPFARLLGQPGHNEADPSPLVALLAPLLFGIMFGDVGQGAVLCAAGWLLRKRAPMLVLLVPGGVMAMLFGLLFGSVFAREDIIAPLWLHPLHDPVALLGLAIGLGAVVLLGGLALNAAQAFWRHGAALWLARDAGLVLAYLGALVAVARPAALWLVPAGALWMAAGSAWTSRAGRIQAFIGGLAQFVEQALQLAVNTVSFARVGAFALAHAGLSVAITGVAEASGAVGYWIVLLLGNLLILVLEGLVVGIQTTRLLLFEFFVRFLKGTGRVFKPLPPPLVQPTP